MFVLYVLYASKIRLIYAHRNDFFSPVWSSYMTNPIVIYYSYQNFMANLKSFIPI